MTEPATAAVDPDDGDDQKRKCARCEAKLPLQQFALKTRNVKAAGERVATCKKCASAKQACRRALRKAKAAANSNKENGHADGNDSDASDASNGSEADPYYEADFVDLPVISIEDFLSVVGREKEKPTLKIAARVDVSKLKEISARKERAMKLAELVWEETNYRFL